MKYYIKGQRNEIIRIIGDVAEMDPSDLPQLSNSKATEAQALLSQRKMPILFENRITTRRAETENGFFDFEWNETIQDYEKTPILVNGVPKSQIAAVTEAAINLFNNLSAGKRALWEPVRQQVYLAVQAGDIALAQDILTTLPPVYDGAEADRAMFLSLFE